jgi:putative copper resistance protein D
VPSLGQVLGDWSFETVPLLLAAACAVLYAAAARNARRWRPARTLAFLLGLAVIVFALDSGVDRYGDELLSLHMVQHLLLTLVAPPLLILGHPLELALRALRPEPRRTLARLLAGRTVRTATSLPVAWSAFAIVMLGSHLPALYQAAVRHPALHDLEHALYVASALLFWLPLLDGDPTAQRKLGMVGRLLYVLLAMPVMSGVGVWLTQAQHVVYPVYVPPARALHVSALADQARAGSIMWSAGTVLMAVAALAVAWLALSGEEQRARRREAYEDRGAPA